MNDKDHIGKASYTRALEILRQHPGISARGFAEQMWPNAEGWHHVCKVGRGATYGAGMWRAGGGYLGRLIKQGLVRREYSWSGQYVYFALAEKQLV